MLGSIIGGQVLPENPDEEKFRQTARELGIDEDKDVYKRQVPRRIRRRRSAFSMKWAV